MQPIVIADVTVSFEEFKRLNQQMLGWRSWVIRLATIAIMLYFLWSNAMDLLPSWERKVGVAVLVAGGMLLLSNFSFRRTLKKVYDGTPVLALPITYTLDADAIHISSAGGQSTFQWSAIRKAQALSGWWLLRTVNGTNIFLATDRVQAPAAPADVTALLQQRSLL